MKHHTIVVYILFILMLLLITFACSGKKYTVYVAKSGEGKVYDKDNGFLLTGDRTEYYGTQSYAEGVKIRLIAVPDEGWRFSKWVGDCEIAENTVSFKLDSDKRLTAYFVETGVTLNFDWAGATPGGDIIIDPLKDHYGIGEKVIITYVPYEGCDFICWWVLPETEITDIFRNPLILIMDSDKQVTVQLSYTLDAYTR